MKLIIDIPDEVLKSRHYCQYFGAWSTKLTETIENGKSYDLRPQGEWIPVSERLPAYSGLYLVSVDDVVTVANFTGTYFMHRGGGRVEVYAWQPLPEPYKEGSDKNV